MRSRAGLRLELPRLAELAFVKTLELKSCGRFWECRAIILKKMENKNNEKQTEE